MKGMFEVRLLVDAKRLGEVLLLLDGKCYNLQQRLVKKESDGVEVLEGEILPPMLMSPSPRQNKSIVVKEAILRAEQQGVKSINSGLLADQLGIARSYMSLIMSEMIKLKLVKRTSIGVFDIIHPKIPKGESK